MFFTLADSDELFTTYDYKRLLTRVEEHFRLQLIAQDVRPVMVSAFFNPEQSKGCVVFDVLDTDPSIMIKDLDFSNGNDILTVFFDSN